MSKDIEAVKAYLFYISKLDEKLKKSLLNDFLRRHVQDVNYCPFVSEEAVKLLKGKVTADELKNIKWPYKSPGDGVPEKIRPLFTNSAKGNEGSEKIFHFEHHIPASMGANELLEINLNSPDVDKKIKAILGKCRLCLITKEEDDKLTKQKWAKERPPNAYEQIGIKLISLDEACKML